MFETHLKRRGCEILFRRSSPRAAAVCTAVSNKGAAGHMGTKSPYCHRGESDLGKLSPGRESILSPVLWKQRSLLSRMQTRRMCTLFLPLFSLLHISCISPFFFPLQFGCLPSNMLPSNIYCAPTKSPSLGQALRTPVRTGLNFGFLQFSIWSEIEERVKRCLACRWLQKHKPIRNNYGHYYDLHFAEHKLRLRGGC